VQSNKPATVEDQVLEKGGAAKFWRKTDISGKGWQKIIVPLRYMRWAGKRTPDWRGVQYFGVYFRTAAEIAIDNIAFARSKCGTDIPTPELAALAARADAVCFGSLGQRAPVSARTIQQFLKTMRPETVRIFDVNLRQSFYSREILHQSLERANVLKLSDEELPVLADLFGLPQSSVESQLGELLQRFSLRLVAYTRGPDGSVLVAPDAMDEHPGCPGKAVDSVGAGDSFTAALCMGVLRGHPLARVNGHANKVATFVCANHGAVPTLPPDIKAS
jgi:sugar/nucleoside kinase (ribokinase family)